jgi:hypothetical protein
VDDETDEPFDLPEWSGQQVGSTVEDPYLPSGWSSYFRALAFDTERLRILNGLIDKGLAERVDDLSGVPHVMFRMDKLGHGIEPDDRKAVENFFRGAMPWYSALGGSGARLNRQLFKSLRDEWRATGWVRMSMFEIP